MKASYRITETDYVRAMGLFATPSAGLLAIYLAAALVLTALAVLGSHAWRGLAIGGLIGGVITVLAGRFVLTPLLARRHYRAYKAIQEEFGVELLDDGVRFTSPDAQGIVTWSKILKWRQDDRYLLIFPMPRLFHIIPKSVATQGFDLERLTSRLRQVVGEPV